jgi:hypothetical protein
MYCCEKRVTTGNAQNHIFDYTSTKLKKIAASSMLHEAKIAYYAFDAAILFVTTIGPAFAKAT